MVIEYELVKLSFSFRRDFTAIVPLSSYIRSIVGLALNELSKKDGYKAFDTIWGDRDTDDSKSTYIFGYVPTGKYYKNYKYECDIKIFGKGMNYIGELKSALLKINRYADIFDYIHITTVRKKVILNFSHEVKESITIYLHSPMSLKVDSRIVTEDMLPTHLIRGLCRRFEKVTKSQLGIKHNVRYLPLVKLGESIDYKNCFERIRVSRKASDKKYGEVRGVIGKTIWRGEDINMILPLLDFAKVFNVGKAVIIGCGQIDYLVNRD